MTMLSRALALAPGLSLALSPVPAAAAPKAPAGPPAACKLKTASGLGYTIVRPGKGAAPVDGNKVAVKYRGLLATNGKEFDKSDNATFGVGDVIPGFAEGLKLTRVGGQTRICIPAALGYGARATGPIPANSDLVFEIELLDIKGPTKPLAVSERNCAMTTESGLGYTILKSGPGGSPGRNDYALINYKGFLAATGAPFDEADAVPLPLRGVVPGFAEGLGLMKKGGSAKLCIPAALGYAGKASELIPANSDLIFLVDLLDYKTAAEVEALQQRQEQPQ